MKKGEGESTTATAKPSTPSKPDGHESQRALWSEGISILLEIGMKGETARTMIGKWRKSYADEKILAAIRDAQRAASRSGDS